MNQAIEIPINLYRDRYWRSILFLFTQHNKLNQYLTQEYFDLDNNIIDISALKKVSAPWSPSEKFMLQLALHLFNSSNKVDLAGMNSLDSYNTSIALKAMELRFA